MLIAQIQGDNPIHSSSIETTWAILSVVFVVAVVIVLVMLLRRIVHCS